MGTLEALEELDDADELDELEDVDELDEPDDAVELPELGELSAIGTGSSGCPGDWGFAGGFCSSLLLLWSGTIAAFLAIHLQYLSLSSGILPIPWAATAWTTTDLNTSSPYKGVPGSTWSPSSESRHTWGELRVWHSSTYSTRCQSSDGSSMGPPPRALDLPVPRLLFFPVGG